LQGPSSSGKSFVLDRVADLFPPEAVLRATALTTNALYYLPPGSLRHRFVVAGERSRIEDDERAEATKALREMISSGKLTKAVAVARQGSEPETILIEQPGPIAYGETTTLMKVFDEDANRCLLLTTDERPVQTKRIITTLGRRYATGCKGDAERIIAKHHAMQRLLAVEAAPVRVPFAERLAEAFDHGRVEARRAFPHVIGMVMASALLHQRQRQRDADGAILAAADDYQLARHLLAGPMRRSLGGGVSGGAARFLDRLLGWFGPEAEFTRQEARKHETAAQSAIYAWVGELVAAGLVEVVEEARGRQPAKYRLPATGVDAESANPLPPIEIVFR
ncbi:MAG: hypothetical protein GYA33_05895, partial [Thermogutta sp.]|nr:hypothetical protein [Thermogutta sp.]